MTDYVAIVLNGLFTGIGVIIAHELWDTYKKYRAKIQEELKHSLSKTNGKNEHKTR